MAGGFLHPGRYNEAMDVAAGEAPVAALLDNHRAFLSYLERRVGDRALAEDILQDAFAKVIARPEQAPADEALVPWFYRTLRNAAIDQFRRRGAADRAGDPGDDTIMIDPLLAPALPAIQAVFLTSRCCRASQPSDMTLRLRKEGVQRHGLD